MFWKVWGGFWQALVGCVRFWVGSSEFLVGFERAGVPTVGEHKKQHKFDEDVLILFEFISILGTL